MYFSSGKRNKKKLAKLNARANSLTDYIAKHDKTLLSLEANKHIKSLLEIEKQKATQKQREKDADNAIKEKGTKKEDVGPKPPHYAQKNGYGTSSSISISDFLTFVNSQKLGNSVLSLDVLDHLDSKRGFDENVTPNLLYSDRASDSISNRALLANALESTIDTSTENGARQLILLNKYKKEI